MIIASINAWGVAIVLALVIVLIWGLLDDNDPEGYA